VQRRNEYTQSLAMRKQASKLPSRARYLFENTAIGCVKESNARVFWSTHHNVRVVVLYHPACTSTSQSFVERLWGWDCVDLATYKDAFDAIRRVLMEEDLLQDQRSRGIDADLVVARVDQDAFQLRAILDAGDSSTVWGAAHKHVGSLRFIERVRLRASARLLAMPWTESHVCALGARTHTLRVPEASPEKRSLPDWENSRAVMASRPSPMALHSFEENDCCGILIATPMPLLALKICTEP